MRLSEFKAGAILVDGDGTDMRKISKSLYFDIRNSLISNPKHYMIEVTGNYDYTATGDIYSNIDNIGIEDNATTL